METFTLKVGSWLRYLATRNPLVRMSDRIEAAATLLVFGVALLATPVAGAMGTAVYDNLQQSFAQARLDRHEIAATVTDDSVPAPQADEKPFRSSIQWQFAGHTRNDDVRTDRMEAGEELKIWIDAEGNRTVKPLDDQHAATEAVVTALGLWFTAVGVATAVWTVLRIRLNRLRYEDWDRALNDLADNGGRTNHNPGPR